MKIALDFINNDVKKEIMAALETRNFDISEGSFGTVWVYGLAHVDYSKNLIELCQKGSLKFYDILLEDLDYFEVWED